MILSGIFASELVDSSAEVLKVKGCDLSTMEEGQAIVNWEHEGPKDGDDAGREVVGRVIAVKKIYKESDCSNDLERHFWEQSKVPFIFGTVRLFTEGGHQGALNLAAIIRDCMLHDEPILLGFSIEGATLETDPHDKSILKRTIAKAVALTVKPCNKGATLAVVSDPKTDRVGFGDIDVGAAAAESTKKHLPGADRRLGGSRAEYSAELLKALEAGNSNAAPGALSGGAVLQKENLGRVLKARALAAFRDWNRVTPFKEFLKNRLPEASQEFLDHFADLIDQRMLRLKKSAEVVAELQAAGKLAKAKGARVKVVAPSEFTIQGKPVPAGTQKVSTFDPAAGVLNTPRGIFQASTPSNPHPHLAIDPGKSAQSFSAEVQASRPHHLRAMKNWFGINDRFHKGDLPPSVVSHAVAFALMSPGIPVPMQEVMYGHLQDALKARGQEAATARNWAGVKKEWMSRNRQGLPAHSRQHFRNIEDELRSKSGSYIGYNKPEKFAEYFGDYLKDHHKDVVDAIREAGGKGSNVARRLTEVRGIAPKLSRYLLGMLGAGDMVVPDTHFLRHYFGGRPDAPGQQPGASPDSATMNYIKNSVLNSVNSHDILEGIDQHYARNHDAVKHVLADPVMGPYFKGREDQAVFPAFWSHWISIPGHEGAIGTPNKYASNMGTDHAPFWDAVKPLLNKAEAEYDPDLPSRTAMQHHRWLEAYGPMQALDLYYRYLVPKLVENDSRVGQQVVRKFEALAVELHKALDDAGKPPAQTVSYKGRPLEPGLGRFNGRPVAIMAVEPKHHIVLNPEKLGGWGPEDLHRVPHGTISVSELPRFVDRPSVASLREDGVEGFNRHPAAQQLVEGFDFGAEKEPSKGPSLRDDVNSWTRHQGKHVYVKPDSAGRFKSLAGDGLISEPRAEAVYSGLAHDFFGLGKHVAPVGLVRDPQSGIEHALIPHVTGYHLSDISTNRLEAVRAGLESDGTLDKMMLMNKIMGNSDRHGQNMLVDSPAGSINLIDHGLIFRGDTNATIPPRYIDPDRVQKPMHPEAVKWLQSLDTKELGSQLASYGVHPELIVGALSRLKHLQSMSPDLSRRAVWHTPTPAVESPEPSEEEDPDSSFEDPDGWVQAKYRRGGEKEYREWKGPTAEDEKSFDGDEDKLSKSDQYTGPSFADTSHPLSPVRAYRAYKNSPHHPVSVLLKYAVHRAENPEVYKGSEQEIVEHDTGWLRHHQQGKASLKNGHLTVADLHRGIEANPKFIGQLKRHQKRLHNYLLEHASHGVREINGVPSIALSRGYSYEGQLGADHALASYSDKTGTAGNFGDRLEHWWVPLKNVWFSYMTGPAGASSETYGDEDEYLVSNHPRVPAQKEDVKQLTARNSSKHVVRNFRPPDFRFRVKAGLPASKEEISAAAAEGLGAERSDLSPEDLKKLEEWAGPAAYSSPSYDPQNHLHHPRGSEELKSIPAGTIRGLAMNPRLSSEDQRKILDYFKHTIKHFPQQGLVNQAKETAVLMAGNPNLTPETREELCRFSSLAAHKLVSNNDPIAVKYMLEKPREMMDDVALSKIAGSKTISHGQAIDLAQQLNKPPFTAESYGFSRRLIARKLYKNRHFHPDTRDAVHFILERLPESRTFEEELIEQRRQDARLRESPYHRYQAARNGWKDEYY